MRRGRNRAGLEIRLSLAIVVCAAGVLAGATTTEARAAIPAPAPPSIAARSAILEDLDTGQVLYRKRATDRVPIASLTKVMTALVVLERLAPSVVVTVGADATNQGGARLGLSGGERISVRELLYAALMQSANDAAVAMADRVAGSEGAFVQLMDDRARALGMAGTRFASATGLDDQGYSTAADLAVLTRLAYRQPLFAAIVRTRFHVVSSSSGPDRRIQNRNSLLWVYPGAIGVKTGFTSAAGHCVVGAARAGDRGVLAVVLGAPGPSEEAAFADSETLMSYGFGAFRRVHLVGRGETLGRAHVGGELVPIVAGEGLAILIAQGQFAWVQKRFEPDRGTHLPRVGERVGTEVVSVGDRVVGSIPALVGRAAPVVPPPLQPPIEPGPLRATILLLAALIRALLAAFL